MSQRSYCTLREKSGWITNLKRKDCRDYDPPALEPRSQLPGAHFFHRMAIHAIGTTRYEPGLLRVYTHLTNFGGIPRIPGDSHCTATGKEGVLFRSTTERHDGQWTGMIISQRSLTIGAPDLSLPVVLDGISLAPLCSKGASGVRGEIRGSSKAGDQLSTPFVD